MLETSLRNTIEFRVIERIKEKYLKVIDFYTESEKADQVQVAKRELQEVLRVIFEMYIIANVTMEGCPDEDIGDRASEKVERRLEKIKLEYI